MFSVNLALGRQLIHLSAEEPPNRQCGFLSSVADVPDSLQNLGVVLRLELRELIGPKPTIRSRMSLAQPLRAMAVSSARISSRKMAFFGSFFLASFSGLASVP